MKKITLYSLVDCTIICNNKEYFLNKNQHLELQDENIKFLQIFPSSSIPNIAYSIKLDNLVSLPHCLVYEKNNNIDILLNLFVADDGKVQNHQSFKIDNKNYKAIVTSCNFFVKASDLEFSYNISYSKSCDVFQFKKTICCLYNNKLIIFSISQKRFYEFDCTNAREYENTLKIENICGNFVCVYEIDENLNCLNTEHYLIKKKHSFAKSLVPLYFLQAIQQKDYVSAKNLCSEKLKNQITDDMLLQYFIKYDYIMIKSLWPLKYALYNNKECKIYAFRLANNKIDDVDFE